MGWICKRDCVNERNICFWLLGFGYDEWMMTKLFNMVVVVIEMRGWVGVSGRGVVIYCSCSIITFFAWLMTHGSFCRLVFM